MFQSARFKLTAWYLLMIMLISLFFSVVIYANVDRELTRLEQIQQESKTRAEEFFGYAPPSRVTTIIEEGLINEARSRLIWDLAILNSCIFLAAGWVGFFLAGRTLAPIKAMIEAQSRFMGDASHELKTPLTSLRTEIEIYLRSKKKTQQLSEKVIKSNLEEVVRLQNLTNSIMELSSLEKAGKNITFEKILINEVLEEGVKNLRKLALSRGIKIYTKTRKQYVFGHKKSLVELATILIDNAVKYSNSGTKINVSNSSKKGYSIIKVEDHGIGISKDDQEHIFDRFFRTDKSRNVTKAPGYGLGLSIAREIVSLHRGEIKVKSSKKGSIFIVELPTV